MFQLVLRNLLKHPVRSFLTVGSLVVALFLLCVLRSLVTTLSAGIDAAQANRLWVQSAVSLFVNMPTSYKEKIAGVEGVGKVGKWQWFGGYYQDPSNFFAQFAVDPEELLDIYPEVDIVEGSREQFLAGRTRCIVGKALADDFGWKVGDTIPILGGPFSKPGGEAWEFEIAALYLPTKTSFDARTIFFHWEYFNQTLLGLHGEEAKCGTFVIELEPGADATAVMASVDVMFENGPQRVQTTTEAEFNRQFISMVGNVPRLTGAIGFGVFISILLACVNTMLMAGREQVRDVGILKAMGFSSAPVFGLLMSQSMILCCLGGGLGILLAVGVSPVLADFLGPSFPGFVIKPLTIAIAVAVTVAIGLFAGIVPAYQASRRAPVQDLRQEI